jgi:antibiotic biosynthesis monooxygenase (ABM) superfamily enzyme
MATTFVQHRVADYDAWRAVYDIVADFQREGGVTEEAVYQTEGDPTNVLVMHRFDTNDEAHAFFDNPDLRQAMIEGGVDADTLRVEFYD